MFRLEASQRTLRVSSAAIRLAPASSATSRAEASSAPPLGTAFGAFLRFDRLRVPRALIFDETYYAKDAWSILNHGVELTLVNNANSIIQAGHTNIFARCNGTASCGEYVVQPEVGKLLIAAGEWLFGLNSF